MLSGCRGRLPFNATPLLEMQAIAAAIPFAIQTASGMESVCTEVAALTNTPRRSAVSAFVRSVDEVATRVTAWHRDQLEKRSDALRDEMCHLLVDGYWVRALELQYRRLDLAARQEDREDWIFEAFFAAQMCTALLKTDEADALARRILAEADRVSDASEPGSRESVYHGMSTEISFWTARERRVGLCHGSPVQLVNMDQAPDLEGRAGTIYGKLWPLTNSWRRLRDAVTFGNWDSEPPRDDWYVVLVESATVTAPLSSLVALVRVFQLAGVVREGGGYRVWGVSLGGVAHEAHYSRDADLTAQAVQLDIASAIGCPTRSLKCVLPNGEILEDGARGDEALRASVPMHC